MDLMRTPRTVDINLTAKCNLKCLYCSHFTSATDTGFDLPAEEWLQFFEELSSCAIMEVVLSGGEPFLYKDFRKIVEGIVLNRMRFSILSNGTLIDEETAAFLASTGRCNYVQVSIDAAKPEIHDACRGKGSFAKALRGFNNLREAGVNVVVRVTINRYNVHDLSETARFLLDDLGLPGFSTNSASYLGLCQQNNEAIGLNVEERSLVMETLLSLNQQYSNRITASAGPLADAIMWTAMEYARKEKKDKFPNGGALTACGCIWSKLAVRPDGVYTPCNQMANIELGRINRDSLEDLWQNSPQLQKLRQRHTIPLSNFPECQSCPYMSYCTGNCPAIAYNLTGDIYVPSPDACLKLFLAEGGRLPDTIGKPAP